MTEENPFKDHDHDGFQRTLPDGRIGYAFPMLFGNGRVAVGSAREPMSFDDAWCYDSVPLAVAALLRWDGTGEPTGWKRHIATGRRRPGGDASKEYIQP